MTRAAHRAQQQLGQSLLLEICKASLPVLLLPRVNRPHIWAGQDQSSKIYFYNMLLPSRSSIIIAVAVLFCA